MSLPIIFCIDDDPHVLRAITRDLKEQYQGRYRVLGTSSSNEGFESLLSFRNRGETVAMFLADQQMPDIQGVMFLARAMVFFPEAKRLLLTAYADKDAAIDAINRVHLDHYLMKPWDPPEEKLYPVIDGLLDDWQNTYRPAFTGVKVVGYQYSQASHEIKEFLAGNLIPYQWVDIQATESAYEMLLLNKLDSKDLPVIFFEDGSLLIKPDIAEIAEKIGLSPELKNDVYDVVIIGAGPAGLAAGVYGASEGLKTLLIEKHAPGGQAGTSSRIENYLGFPAGISGAELTARALTQAKRLGLEFLSPKTVKFIEEAHGYKTIVLENGIRIDTRSVILTTGVQYRKLETKGIADFTGAGIYYGSSTTEATACKDKEVYVVGGGNSAGQCAMYLSKFAKNVYILVRKENLVNTMSAYLIDQINEAPNIQVFGKTEIIEVCGSDRLEKLIVNKLGTKYNKTREASALYIFIGAKPFTDWIQLNIRKNPQGFVLTGSALKTVDGFKKNWKLSRDPYLLETSCPGVFAAGDVRAGAMNRVASAVGEGSMAISLVHKYLAEVK
jgi:thioredoxin reductase (NADPH)